MRRSPRSAVESYTAYHHLRATAAQGVVAGVFLLNEYVARKELGATRLHVLALLLAPALCQFVAVAWNPATRGWLRRPFRALGVPGRLVLLAPLLLVPLRDATPFVAIVALSAAIEVLLIPAQNAVVASNYSSATRGRWFGLVTAVQALAIVMVSIPAGWLLDRSPSAWPWLHAVAGLAGAWAYLQWSRLRRRSRRFPVGALPSGRGASALHVLFTDRTFLAFEACFMVYGIGFLALQPVLPLYLVDEVGVTYAQVGTARGLVFWLAMLVGGPVAGWLADRLGLLRTCGLFWIVLAGFPALLLLAPGVTGLYAAFAVFGVAMAGVHVVWNLGPIALAGDADPVPYLNAHLGLVGIRALVGMVGGSWVQSVLGSRAVFGAVLLLELVAAAGILVTAHRTGRRWRRPPRAPGGAVPVRSP